jgi:transaldolase
MKIFLDTADTEVIARHFATGLVDGVTTNPTLIMKSGKNPEEVYQKIKDIGVKDISMEVMGNWTEMLEEGRRLSAKFGDVATIKVPCTHDGLMTCRYLSQVSIKFKESRLKFFLLLFVVSNVPFVLGIMVPRL